MGNTQTSVKDDDHPYFYQKNETKRNFDKKYYICRNNNTSYCAIGIKIIETMISVYYIDGSEIVLKNTYSVDRRFNFNKQILRKLLSVSYIYKLISLISEGRLIICSYADISNGGIEYIGKYDIPETEGLQKIELLENHYCLIYERPSNLIIRFIPYIGDRDVVREFELGCSLFRFSRCCKYFMIIGQMIEIYGIGHSIERISQQKNTFGRCNISMNGKYLVRWGESTNKLFIETHNFETIYSLDIPKNDSIEYIIYDYSELADILSTSNLLVLVGIDRVGHSIEYHLISPNDKYGPFYIMRNENIISFCSHGPYIMYGVPDGTIIYCFDHLIPIKILEIIRNETKKYIDRENENGKENESTIIKTDTSDTTISLIGADDSVATYRMDRNAISILSCCDQTNSMDIICNVKIYNEMTTFEIFVQMIATNRIDRLMIRQIDAVIFNMLIDHMIEYVRSFIYGDHRIAYCGYLIMEIILLRIIDGENNMTCIDLFVDAFPIFKTYLCNCILLIKNK